MDILYSLIYFLVGTHVHQLHQETLTVAHTGSLLGPEYFYIGTLTLLGLPTLNPIGFKVEGLGHSCATSEADVKVKLPPHHECPSSL